MVTPPTAVVRRATSYCRRRVIRSAPVVSILRYEQGTGRIWLVVNDRGRPTVVDADPRHVEVVP